MSRHRSTHPAIQLFPFLAVLVSVMGALIFLLLITSKRIPQVAVARARAAQARVAVTPTENVGPILSIPELASAPTDDELPEMPLVDLAEEGPSPAELCEQERDAAREAERLSLIDQWRQRIKTLQSERDQFQLNVQQQQLLTTAAERQQLKMLGELQELERKLGSLTGKITAGSMHSGHSDRERIQLEQRILGLRRQLKMTADQQRADAGKYSIVPFDGKSGTTRRPLLVECTDTGFRFVPEDVFISAADIEGFTERQNPLLAGAVALTQYWNQVNQQQGGATPDTQPYVLLIVRPSGTLGYYVSVRLLAALKQQHGYELIAEDVQLNWPKVDVGAQAACRAAVEGMLAQRPSIAAHAGGAGFRSGMGQGTGTSTGGNSGSRFPPGASVSGRPGSAGTGPRSGFQLSDVDPSLGEDADQRWVDVNEFRGREQPRGSGTGRITSTDEPNRSRPPAASNNVNRGNPAAATAESEPPRGQPARNAATNSSNSTDWIARPTIAPREPTHLNAETTPGSPQPVASAAEPRPTAAAPQRITGGSASNNRSPQQGAPNNSAVARRPGSAPAGEQRLARGPQRGNGQEIPYEMLQHRRWGQFEDGANIGLEKPITIFVDADQIIVAEQLIIPIHPGATRNELFDMLLSAIDENAATWGRAASGFFWVPSLRFVISPGGNQIYHRLSPLVTRSGLRADAEFTLDKPQSLPKGGRP